MKIRILIFCFLGLFTISLHAAKNDLSVDSIMKHVMETAETYSDITQSYEADIYMHTLVETKKKNFLYKYVNLIPHFVLHDPKNDKAIIESVSILKFKAPNNYSQDLKYVSGTLTQTKEIAMLPFRFITMDIYDESIHGETFFLPLRKKTSKYYQYSIASVDDVGDRKIYSINFTPIYKNRQLISGTFTVEDNTWRVLGFYGRGEDLFVDFTFDLIMGDKVNNQFLPVKFNIVQSYSYFGNKVYNTYQADINYRDIKFNTIQSNKKNYNLGNTYRMRLDSVPVNNDSVLWDKLRSSPLAADEKQFLDKHNAEEKLKEREKAIKDSISPRSNKAALNVMKNVILTTNYRFKTGDINFSGLINPAMLGYSTLDGISYRQVFNLGINLPRQQRINLNLFGGYIFGRKLLSYGLKSVWNYEPKKLGYLSLAVGRGNPTYSNHFIGSISDSMMNNNNSNFGYHRDYYVKLFNSIEISNGLQLGLGVDYHIREPIKDDSYNPLYSDGSKILGIQYSFIPLINLSWTPEQYYVLDRNQKVYVRSQYPTFKIEFAQNINGILGSKSSSNRLEFDINQRINFGLMKSLNYHAGFGFYSNQKNEFFNDFTYFTKTYFPETWGDGIGGVFNVLPVRLFNSSDKYAQAHLMYESSNFLLTKIPLISEGISKERIYLSQLLTPSIHSFTEIGYGIGNRFLNAAVFVALHNLKYQSITAKAVFFF